MSDVLYGDLLPSAATPFERALADVEGDASRALPAEILSTLWRADAIPAALLPYLAWAVSVDVWDGEWPLDVRRAVAAASPDHHRRKGTPASIRRLLTLMQMEVRRIDEWHLVDDLARGHARVTIAAVSELYPARPLISARQQIMAEQAVRRTKPKSRPCALRFVVDTETSLGLGAAVAVAAVVHLVCYEPGVAVAIGASVSIAGIVRLKGQEVH